MNTPKKRSFGVRTSVGTGTTSLLMIFTVVCFATLAMLSLSTAASNQRIQQRSIEGATALMDAEGEAAQQLAALDEALAGAATQNAAEAAALALGWQNSGDGLFAYTLNMDATHQLLTEVEFTEQNGEYHYQLVRQISSFTGEWTPDEGSELWPGQQ